MEHDEYMLSRKFARKKLSKEHWENKDDIERFKREINFLNKLQGNPHVINLVDFILDHKVRNGASGREPV